MHFIELVCQASNVHNMMKMTCLAPALCLVSLTVVSPPVSQTHPGRCTSPRWIPPSTRCWWAGSRRPGPISSGFALSIKWGEANTALRHRGEGARGMAGHLARTRKGSLLASTSDNLFSGTAKCRNNVNMKCTSFLPLTNRSSNTSCPFYALVPI